MSVPDAVLDAREQRTILVVDDHGLIVFGLTHALRSRGYEVVVRDTPDVEAVTALAREHPLTLAIVDLQFDSGEAEGLALIGPLRDLSTRTVVLTGVTDPAVLGACLEAGAVGVIRKGESFEAVLDAIDAALADQPVNSSREHVDLLGAARANRTQEENRLAPFRALSVRECEVLARLVAGAAAPAIAEELFLSLPTVRMHIQRVLQKLGVHSQVAAVAQANDAGWRFDPDAPQVHQF